MGKMCGRHRWSLAGAISGIFALFAYYATIALRRSNTGHYSDFHVCFSAARAMLLHQDPYSPAHRSYIYPPLIAFPYMPLTLLIVLLSVLLLFDKVKDELQMLQTNGLMRRLKKAGSETAPAIGVAGVEP